MGAIYHINIKNLCNQHCFFCTTQKLIKDGTLKETSPDELKKEIVEAVKFSKTIRFSGGGEPTTYSHLPELIEFAKEKGFQDISVETNAVKMSDKRYLDELIKRGLTSCIVSLHSHKPEISDKITQAAGTFQMTIEGMKNISGSDLEFRSILCTITSLNYGHIKDFIRFVSSEFPNINEVSLSLVRPIEGEWFNEGLTPKIEEIMPQVREAIEFGNRNKIMVKTSPTLGIPLCHMKGIEKHSGEFEYYLSNGKQKFVEIMSQYDKVKSKECQKCSFNECCSGVERAYSKLFGFDELKHRVDNPDRFSTEELMETNELVKNHQLKKHIMGRLEVNRFCNQRCIFCSNPPIGGELEFGEIKSRMERMRDQGVNDIMLTGGEPTMRKDIFEILDLATEMGFEEISIQSNGTMLHNENFARKFTKYKNLKFTISFHASHPKLFGILSQAPKTYEWTLQSLDNLRKFEIFTFVVIVIQKLNYKYLKSHLMFLRKNYPNIEHFSFNFVDPIQSARENSDLVVPKLTEAEPYMREAFSYILKEGCTFRIEKAPLCFLRGFEHYQSIVRREAVDEKRIFSFYKGNSKESRDDRWMVEDGETRFYFADKCSQCSLKQICPGLNKDYAAIYGYDEIEPVKDRDPIEIIDKVRIDKGLEPLNKNKTDGKSIIKKEQKPIITQ